MGKLIAVDKRKWDGSVSAGEKALLLETEQAGASAAAIGQTTPGPRSQTAPMADTDKAGHGARARSHPAAALSVRDERLAKAVADRVTGRIMELLDIDEQLNRLQEHIEQSREARSAYFQSLPDRTEAT